MTGFLHAVLVLPAAASEQMAPVLPLGGHCGLKEPAGRNETPQWPGEGTERRRNLSTTQYSRKGSF